VVSIIELLKLVMALSTGPKRKKNLICKVGQGTIIFIENRTKSVFHNSLGFLDSLYLPFVVFAGKCHSPRFSQIYSC